MPRVIQVQFATSVYSQVLIYGWLNRAIVVTCRPGGTVFDKATGFYAGFEPTVGSHFGSPTLQPSDHREPNPGPNTSMGLEPDWGESDEPLPPDIITITYYFKQFSLPKMKLYEQFFLWKLQSYAPMFSSIYMYWSSLQHFIRRINLEVLDARPSLMWSAAHVCVKLQ